MEIYSRIYKENVYNSISEKTAIQRLQEICSKKGPPYYFLTEEEK